MGDKDETAKYIKNIAVYSSFFIGFKLTCKCHYLYIHSPSIVAVITDNGLLKILVRVLLAPVIALVYLIYHPVLLATVLVLLGMVFCYRARAGKRVSRA